MAYSKAYQEVTAGRVREDEAIGYFGDNKVTVPGKGSTAFKNVGGKTQPTIEKDHLNHEGRGKRGTSADNAAAYYPPTQNVQ